MNRIFVLVMFLTIMFVIQFGISEQLFFSISALPTLSFGFILLVGYLLSDVFYKMRLPRITAYLIAGIIFGPYFANLLTDSAVANLRFIDDLALNFIALAAGGELRIRKVISRLKPILLLITIGSVVIFIGVTITLSSLNIDFFKDRTWQEIIVMCSLCGIIAIARSPSSAIAIISETRASGKFTDTVLSVTVVTDVIIIPLFAIAASFAKIALHQTGQQTSNLTGLFSALGSSILAGIILGWIISLYFKYIGRERVFFILAIIFITAKMSHFISDFIEINFRTVFELEPMVICMTAGFVIQNLYDEGNALIHAIDRSALPVYVLFFSLTGAALNINILKDTWHIAIIIVFLRLVYISIGSFIGGRLGNDPVKHSSLYGLSFITQAGVSFGLAKILQREFPEWGSSLTTVLIASIIINQIIGPVLMKFSLDAVRETHHH
ncbi:cation:proton antiporter [bacterium]|nr:cation:proton antiporter [candidate division CSSED10-310 bacterium]